VQDRGLAAYISELVGTFFLVFIIGVVVCLFVATTDQAQTGSDFAVIGLVHAFALFALIMTFGAASGGHFNPAVTVAAWATRRIDPLDAVVFILAQLSGAVLGALLVKGLLLDEGRAAHYGAATISPILAGNFAGAVVEALGTFVLVLTICCVAFNPNARREWAPWAIGCSLGLMVMIFGPLTGGSFNPARWFGPALIGDEWGGVWPYIVGPLVGCLLAAGLYRFVIAGPQFGLGEQPPTGPGRTIENVAADVETVARPRRK
jgi:MIP family channel proteins